MSFNFNEENCFITNITPQMAEEWLGNNNHNRNPREKTINQIVKDLINNKWEFNGESIKFSKDGELLDGQHRLIAICRSGISAKSMVVTGITPTTHIDDFTARSLSDRMICGRIAEKGGVYAHPVTIAIANYLTSWKYSKDAESMVAYIKKHEKAFETALNCLGKKTYAVPGLRKGCVMAAIVQAFENGVPESVLVSWSKVVLTGVMQNDYDETAIRFRNFIISVEKSSRDTLLAFKMTDANLRAQYSIYNFWNKKAVSISKAKEYFPMSEIV